jgi:hypothetical protein
MIYLSGSTNDRDEPQMIAAGIGLIAQPGNGYWRRVDRYHWWAADNGCFTEETYVGDDAWLDWLDRLPRDRCLFAVLPDVARRPDGSLGGDPVATWERFGQLVDIVRDLGFPPALAAQNGIENMANLHEQLDACDALFLAGGPIDGGIEWKESPAAAHVARLARNQGRWVHMGRVNTRRRLELARAMGCNSADGTFMRWARRRRARDTHSTDRDRRGVADLEGWYAYLASRPPLPLDRWETPSLPVHRQAAGP